MKEEKTLKNKNKKIKKIKRKKEEANYHCKKMI